MIDMSKIIKIDEIQEGMVLFGNIYNKYGQQIAPDGLELVDRHIKLFRIWNVDEIRIKEETDDEILEDDGIRALADKILKSRMKWTPSNAIEKNLFHTALKQLMMKISRNDDGKSK